MPQPPWRDNLATVRSGHGSKTALSEEYEVSRPTVYAAGATAESVLRAHFETPLLQGAAVTVRVDDAQLRRALVAPRVLAPNAIRPIEDLLRATDHETALAHYEAFTWQVIARLPSTDFELPVAAVHDWLATRTPPRPLPR